MTSDGDVFDRDDWWDADGFAYGLHELLNPVRIPYINEQAIDPGPDRILDVGCGGGYVATNIDGRLLVGIDISAQAIGAAHHRGSDAVFAVGDAERLPFADASFDLVIMSEVLEHLPNGRAGFGEAARVMKPGGRLVITGPNRTFRSRLVLIWLAQEWPTRLLPRALHKYGLFIRPHELMSWAEHESMGVADLTGVGTRAGDIPRILSTLIGLRFKRFTFAEAARKIRLRRSKSTAVAYMMTILK